VGDVQVGADNDKGGEMIDILLQALSGLIGIGLGVLLIWWKHPDTRPDWWK